MSDLLIKISYSVEILLGAFVFLHAYPRRKRFAQRMALSVAALLAGGYPLAILRSMNGIATFAGLLATIALTVAGMVFVFDAPFQAILSACVSGVAAQHIAHQISRMLSLLRGMGRSINRLEFICAVCLYAVLYLTIGRASRRSRYYEYCDNRVTAVSMLIVLICTGITRILRLGGQVNAYITVCTCLYAIVCCVLALSLQFFLCYFVQVKSEYLLLRHINKEERRQYEISRENAEQMSIKYHDLKHKLVSLEGRLPQSELDSMRSIIETYDSTYHTGLDVLDILLNEKNVHCRSKNISLTCMGYGGELNFMETMDIYSLFGNIIDNAITAVEKIKMPEKRLISLIIEQKGSLVYINTVNYISGTVPAFVDGLPGTSKTEEAGFHGFGLKSVRQIAQKYHGDIALSAEDDVFKVSIYMIKDKMEHTDCA